MITKEYLAEQKAKYQDRADYFKKISFDVLEEDFQGVVKLIEEMEDHLKEQENSV